MRILALVLAFVLALLLVAPGSPASAKPMIALSQDGISWADELDGPLFDPDQRWVPGDEQTRSFHVRNQGGDPAELAIDVLGDRARSLMESGDLTISVRTAGGVWRHVSVPGTQRLVSGVGLGAGRQTKVDVTAALAVSSSNATQRRRLDLDLRVLLVQDTSAVNRRGTASVRDGILPDTGAPALWSLVAATALVVAGTILTSRRRTKVDTHG